jgi:hypothetical protein
MNMLIQNMDRFEKGIRNRGRSSSLSTLYHLQSGSKASDTCQKRDPIFNNLFAHSAVGNVESTEEILGIVAAWKRGIRNRLPEKFA